MDCSRQRLPQIKLSKRSIKGSFSSDIKLKFSVANYKPSSSLSINLQLLCFMRGGGRGVPSDMFVVGHHYVADSVA